MDVLYMYYICTSCKGGVCVLDCVLPPPSLPGCITTTPTAAALPAFTTSTPTAAALPACPQVHYHHANRSGFKVVTSSSTYSRDMATTQFCLAPTGGGHGKRNVLVSMVGGWVADRKRSVPVSVVGGWVAG